MGLYDRGYVRNPYGSDGDYEGGTQLRFGVAKPMVTLIIIVTCSFYLVDFVTNNKFIYQWLTLYPDTWQHPERWFQFLSYGLVHAPQDIMHVAFNMLGLFFLGPAVEQRLGRFEFLRFYLVSIFLGGIVSNIVRYGSGAPVIGASGGVEAVVMLFVYQNPSATLYFYGILPVRAWVLGIILVAGNLFFAKENTAVEVHLAGIAFATAYFFVPFSLAWLSWNHWFSEENRRLRAQRKTRATLRVHTPEETSMTDDEAEADRILDKIHREGEANLTPKERETLERYSRRMRERRS
jgi:membrane associated rhomboid family serine protease